MPQRRTHWRSGSSWLIRCGQSKERAGMEQAAKAGLVKIHGTLIGACFWWSSWTFPGAEQTLPWDQSTQFSILRPA